MDKEEEAFFCLKALLRLSHDACPPAQIVQRYALCVSLFRSLLPQLFAHLQSMFIDTSKWLLSWLQFLFSVELPLSSLLRLWDFYFSDDECVQLHMFVCLGMLQVQLLPSHLRGPHSVRRPSRTRCWTLAMLATSMLTSLPCQVCFAAAAAGIF